MTTAAPPMAIHLPTVQAKSLEVRPYTPPDGKMWDDFVDRSPNGTLFHLRRFLAYHPRERFADASLLVYRRNRLIAVFPATWGRDELGHRMLISHPGASYGGPAFAPNVKTSWVYDAMAAISAWAADHDADVQLRLPPHIFYPRPLYELDFVLAHLGYTPYRVELSTYVELSPGTDPMAPMSTACRHKVRQAMRAGLHTGLTRALKPFWSILAENLLTQHGVTPTHTLAELAHLHRRFPDRIRLFGAWDHLSHLLAGVLVIDVTATAAHTFYMASRAEAQHYRPLNLVVNTVLHDAGQRGLSRVNFGVSTPNGQSINWGLLAFKEGFGGHGVCRTTYRLRRSTSQGKPA